MKHMLPALFVLVSCVGMSVNAQADDAPINVSFGVSLQPSRWEGDNKNGGSSFDTTATQLQLNLNISKGKYYGGLGFQGAEFDFSGGAPNKVNKTVSVQDDNATIGRGEFDLVFGYYFWSQVSLFLDLKSITNNWKGDNYSLRYEGLGFGVSGFNPINDDWTFFGSLGFINLNIRADGDAIGDGKGSALVVGMQYKISDGNNFTISLKSQHNEYEFDQGSKQDHQIGSLVFGYSHTL